MSDKVTLKTERWRVQLGCIDLTGDGVPVSVRQPRPNWFVRVLSAGYHPNTAFSRGEQAYWGDDPDQALEACRRYVRDADMQIPTFWLRRMLRWARQETEG